MLMFHLSVYRVFDRAIGFGIRVSDALRSFSPS